MKPHVKNYLKAHGYTIADVILCESCSAVGKEIHHIQHRQKNNSELDESWNLICLCVECHIWIHKNNTYENKQRFFDIVKEKLK